ncbi:hypothetical protein GIB67_019648 [Kingdonia uniflora]|uniref:RRM domain-containing protein n=1 Tax=Kingdonia uniflora TaxID=39325 RepID=A0A7J7N197_9MAGN|nr:hypothetical protein GIB67_019648 [Kingdonia uniflora]
MQVFNIKVIRNRQTSQSEGYGFVEFSSRAAAEKVLSYNGTPMPNTEQPFRLNWASFNAGERRAEGGQDHSIFVGDLGSDVTDAILQETFGSKFPSVKGAKVVIDATTGRSKGYGFVRFGDDNERSQALTEMNGAYCSNRPMRINVATPRKPSGYQQQSQAVVLGGGYGSNAASSQNFQTDEDSNNTTFKFPFSVMFFRSNAEEALQGLNGTTIGKNTVRLSWGRSPVNKQPRSDNGNQWNGGGAYYGGQAYDGSYGYAAPVSQDPNMYAAAASAYGAYPTYGNNQQQVS